MEAKPLLCDRDALISGPVCPESEVNGPLSWVVGENMIGLSEADHSDQCFHLLPFFRRIAKIDCLNATQLRNELK